MEKNIKKYTPMFEDQEILTKEEVKESMAYMMTDSDYDEMDQSDEVYVNSMLMQEVIMNSGINEFIDVFVSAFSMKGMDGELYDCLISIAEEQGMSIDSMYMDNLEATIDVMNYDNDSVDSGVVDYGTPYESDDIDVMDYNMSYETIRGMWVISNDMGTAAKDDNGKKSKRITPKTVNIFNIGAKSVSNSVKTKK